MAFKEWKETTRDRLFLLLAFLLPALWLVVFGYGLNLDVEDIPFAVVDRDHSEFSREYLQRFIQSRYFSFRGYVDEERTLDRLLAETTIRAAIIVPERFQEQLAAGVDAAFMQAKIITARFYADHLLSRIPGERDVIVEERRQRVDNNPGSVLGERMRAMLWPHHPYGTPVIGWLHEIQSLDRETALQFYRTWYAPNNAILVVAGDVDAAELRPLAERYFGRLRPTRDLPSRTWVSDPPNVGPMRVTHRDEKVRQPSFSRLYRAISYGTDTGHQAHALDVAMEILGGSETSRLYRALVEDQRIAVSAGASASSSGLGGGSVSIWATPVEGVTLEQVEAAADAVIAEFLRDGPTDVELTRAKNSLSANAIYSRDSQESLANIYGSSLAQGESIDDVVNWPANVEAVTRDDVITLSRQTLDINASVTGWLLPEQGQ